MGVTQVDPAAVVRTKRVRTRNLAAFLGVGDSPDEEVDTGKVEPPSDEVRREMLRLELAALEAEIEARTKEAEANLALPPDDSSAPARSAEPG